MGHIVPFRVEPGSRCIGKSVGELKVRSMTGAVILVLTRGEGNSFLPVKTDVLQAGDVLTLAGTPEAVEAARSILEDPPGGPQ